MEDYEARFKEMSSAELSRFIADVEEAYHLLERRKITAGHQVLSSVLSQAKKERVRKSRAS